MNSDAEESVVPSEDDDDDDQSSVSSTTSLAYSVSSVAERLILSLHGDDTEDDLCSLLHNDAAAITDLDIHQALCQAAAVRNSVQAIRLLWQKVDEGRKFLYTDDYVKKVGPLHVAAKNGNSEVVRFLVDAELCGFNVNQVTHGGTTPLCLAAFRYCTIDEEEEEEASSAALETCLVLLKNGADPDHGCIAQNITNVAATLRYFPLGFAIQKNKVDLARLLLEHGANPKDNGSDTGWCIVFGRSEMLALLLEHRGRCDTLDYNTEDGSPEDYTALNVLLEDEGDPPETKLTISRLLIEHYTKLESTSRTDNTAALAATSWFDYLQRAFDAAMSYDVRYGTEYCALLLEAGFDPIIPMYRAIVTKKRAFCEMLVQLGVDPFLKQERGTFPAFLFASQQQAFPTSAFLFASQQQDTDILDFFLGHWEERFSFYH